MKINDNTIYLLLLLVITVIIYFPALHNTFNNWDDDAYFVSNSQIELNTENVKKAFQHGETHRMYLPITAISNSIVYNFYKLNPKPYLASNIALHICNIILLFIFLTLLFNDSFIPIIVASLFALHPMNVEAVAYAAGKRDVLYVFFYLLCLIFYLLRRNKNRKYIFYFLSFIFALLALLSKGQALTIPLVLIVIDIFFNGKKWNDKNVYLNKIPFFIISVIVAFLIYKAPVYATGNFHNSKYNIGQNGFILTMAYYKIVYAAHSFLYYILKSIFPVWLSPVHPYPTIHGGIMQIPFYYYLQSAVVIFILCFFLFSKKINDNVKFGFAFFTINILMLLQIIGNSFAITNDHYLYFSGIGIFIIASDFFIRILTKYKFLLITIVISYLTFFCFKTSERIQVFKNSITLWNDVIKNYPDNYFGYFKRGTALIKEEKYISAFVDFKKSFEINPNYSLSCLNLALIYDHFGNDKAALNEINSRLFIDSANLKLLNARGYFLYRLHDFQKAEKDFSKVIAINPQSDYAFYYRGFCRYKQNHFKEAISDYKTALHLSPQNFNYYVSLDLAKLDADLERVIK